MDHIWTADMKSSEAMILAVMNAIFAIGVWTRDLAIPVRRSNQLSYEVTDVGSWSFVGSNFPVRNESTNVEVLKISGFSKQWLKFRP